MMSLSGKDRRFVIPFIYIILFFFFLLIAAVELILPFSLYLPPYYTADIPLGLYLAYLVSYPGVCVASLISLDTTGMAYLPSVFVISLIFYLILGTLIRLVLYSYRH